MDRDVYAKLITKLKNSEIVITGEAVNSLKIDFDASLGKPVLTDKVPYIFRQTAGNPANFGSTLLKEKLIGGTVAWNQFVKNGNFVNTSNWNATYASFSTASNIGKFTASATDGRISQTISFIVGHKYLFLGEIKTTTATTSVGITGALSFTCSASTNWQKFSYVLNAINTVNYFITIDRRESEWDEVQVRNYMYFDLTQMFGSTIADAIYAMEQETAGSGVAWFRSLFPKDYYAYNAGELMSVQAGSKVIRDADDKVIATYPFDTDIILRGIPKWADGKMYYDGDEYESDGTVTRYYGYRAYESGDESLANAITDGTNTVYKLTTPTTETADPYYNPQVCSPDGTEEFISWGERNVDVPVGHDTEYLENIQYSAVRSETVGDVMYGTATRAINSGEFFIMNNTLYKATANIADGATITPGTNCTATSISAELTALWTAVNT